MYNENDLKKLTENAKKKLNEQYDQDDIYGEFREEFNEIKKENNIVVNKINKDNNQNQEEDYYNEPYERLKYEMDEEEYHEEDNLMSDAAIRNNEDFLFPGGPSISELEGWKLKYEGATVYWTKISDDALDANFVFRTLNRFEYKQLIRQVSLDASQREELICETCVLFPYNYNWRNMAKREAGVPATLSQIIMQKSGFTDEYYIERL